MNDALLRHDEDSITTVIRVGNDDGPSRSEIRERSFRFDSDWAGIDVLGMNCGRHDCPEKHYY